MKKISYLIGKGTQLNYKEIGISGLRYSIDLKTLKEFDQDQIQNYSYKKSVKYLQVTSKGLHLNLWLFICHWFVDF